MKSNISNIIVQNGICIGCGLCAGICPSKTLKIEFNKYGEYIPVNFADKCLSKCKLCLEICPFYDSNPNETEIAKELFGSINNMNYTFETGYYIDCYAGYSNKFRNNGASGGITTWLLETLLKTKSVDYAVCVESNPDTGKLFKYNIYSDAEAISNSSGSAYYPVELSEIVKIILEIPGKYVITGLPCFLKGVRLAAIKNKKIAERIIFTIGLVCGQMKSRNYTAYLAKLSQVNGKLEKVHFRGKDFNKPAGEYFFSCMNKNGDKGKLFWNEGVSKVWLNRWFTPNACNFCDDIFAEVSDITLMDAWLPEYIKDSHGTNLVISRNKIINEVLRLGIEKKELKLNKTDIREIINSQSGVLNVKRKRLAYRLYCAKKMDLFFPKKRIAPSEKVDFYTKVEVKIRNRMQLLSKCVFINNNICEDEIPQTAKIYETKLAFYLLLLKTVKRLNALFINVVMIFKQGRINSENL